MVSVFNNSYVFLANFSKMPRLQKQFFVTIEAQFKIAQEHDGTFFFYSKKVARNTFENFLKTLMTKAFTHVELLFAAPSILIAKVNGK